MVDEDKIKGVFGSLVQEVKEGDLFIESWSNAQRTIEVRGFTRGSLIRFDHVTSSDRSLATNTIRISQTPLTISVTTTSTGVRRGELFVRLSFRVAGDISLVLAAGYITDEKGLSWPPGTIENMIDGRGLIRSITGTDPGAGSEISETVPTNARWRLIGTRFELVTDANVANRRVDLAIDDGTNILMRIEANSTQAESLTIQYNFMSGLGINTRASDTDQQASLPTDLYLAQGFRIRTDTSLFQAGDDFGAPQLLVEEWLQE